MSVVLKYTQLNISCIYCVLTEDFSLLLHQVAMKIFIPCIYFKLLSLCKTECGALFLMRFFFFFVKHEEVVNQRVF